MPDPMNGPPFGVTDVGKWASMSGSIAETSPAAAIAARAMRLPLAPIGALTFLTRPMQVAHAGGLPQHYEQCG